MLLQPHCSHEEKIRPHTAAGRAQHGGEPGVSVTALSHEQLCAPRL